MHDDATIYLLRMRTTANLGQRMHTRRPSRIPATHHRVYCMAVMDEESNHHFNRLPTVLRGVMCHVLLLHRLQVLQDNKYSTNTKTG